MNHPWLQFGISGTALLLATAGSHATFAPASGLWGHLISHGATDGPRRVALTFDDGPTAGATDSTLDVLAELGVKAAFFVIGRNVAKHPDLLRRIQAEGHLIGNHTYDHCRLGVLRGLHFWRDQIARTDDAIERVLGQRPLFFRPPIGHKTPIIMSAARRGRHSVVTWSVRAWDGLPTTTERIVQRVIPRCKAGSIVLLHDGAEPGRQRNAAPTVAAMKPLINGLRERGFELARLDEITGLHAYADAASRQLS